MSGDQQREAVARAIYSLGGYSEQVWEDIDPDLRAQVLRDADVVLSALAPVAADEIEGRIWAWLNRYDAPWSPSDAKVRDLASDIAALAPVQPIPDSMRGAIDISDDDEPLRTVRMVPVDDVQPVTADDAARAEAERRWPMRWASTSDEAWGRTVLGDERRDAFVAGAAWQREQEVPHGE